MQNKERLDYLNINLKSEIYCANAVLLLLTNNLPNEKKEYRGAQICHLFVVHLKKEIKLRHSGEGFSFKFDAKLIQIRDKLK